MAAASSSGMSKWLQASWWPIILVTGGTVASMGVYFKRHFRNDPEIGSAPTANTKEPGFGRKSAEATGLMEGDRAFQGIFPAKKMTEKLAPILPTTDPSHPSHPAHGEKMLKEQKAQAAAAAEK